MSDHAYFMQRALSLATRGCLSAHPNPMVGCVIVKKNHIVGEGWHIRPGTPHAEIHALQQAGAAAAGADVYVNLEPCNHTGRTPPCVDALIAAKVKRVIIPFADPNPLVNGQGLLRLKQAGIEIISDIETEKARELNRFFLKAMSTKQAYVIAKWAMTLDGQLTRADQQRWITGAAARDHVHQQRAQVGAILIGANTLRVDKPQLTARPANIAPEFIQQPKRIILSSNADIASEFLQSLTGETWIISATPKSTPSEFSHIHYQVLPDASHPGKIDLSRLLTWLVEQNCHSVIVEGGHHTHTAFFNDGLVDELHIYQALMHSGYQHKSSIPFFYDQSGWAVDETKNLSPDLFIRATKHV